MLVDAAPAPTAASAAADARGSGCSAAAPTLVQANREAVRLARAGEHQAAAEALTRALARAAAARVTHADLHALYSNRAASRLALGDAPGALSDADEALRLMAAWAARCGAPGAAAHPSYPRAALRRGRALLALGDAPRAAAALEAGLAADPANAQLASALSDARAAGGWGCAAPHAAGPRALPAPAAASLARVGYAQPNAPLALLRAPGDAGGGNEPDDAPDNLDGAGSEEAWRRSLTARRGARVEGAALPAALLSARRAAEDRTLCDVYEYARVQTDICMPKRWAYRSLPDGYRWSRWWEAVQAAMRQLAAAGVTAPRVLVLGCGGGMLPLMALKAGAGHVTCAERWPHLAQACGEVLAANGAVPGSFRVAAVRQYDELALGGQVEAAAHLLLADLVDDGVLTGGLLPSVAHALAHLVDPSAPGPLVVPAGLEVLVQPVAVSAARCRAAGAAAVAAAAAAACAAGAGAANANGGAAHPTSFGDPEGAITGVLDLSELDEFRWCPSQALPSPLRPCALAPLAPPKSAWAFDCLAPPEGGGVRELEVAFEKEGAADALAVWARVRLIGDIMLTTGFDRPLALEQANSAAAAAAGAASGTFRHAPPSQQPALLWLPGKLPVSPGDVIPFTATHNTVRLGFEAAASTRFAGARRPAPSFPQARFAAAADGARLEALALGLRRALPPRVEGPAGGGGAEGGAGASGRRGAGACVLDVGCGAGALSIAAVALAHGAAQQGAGDAAATSGAVEPGAEQPAAAAAAEPGTVPSSAAGAVGQGAPSTGRRKGGAPRVASVVGVELYEPLAACARRGLAAAASAGAAAAGGGGDGGSGAAAAAPEPPRAAVLLADAAKLERGGDAIPTRGVDVIVADVFEPSLFGARWLQLPAAAKAKLLAPGGRVLPRRAALWAAGVQALSGRAGPAAAEGTEAAPANGSGGDGWGGGGCGGQGSAGWDFSPLDRYRWAPEAEAADLASLPHVMLTSPVKVFDLDLDGGGDVTGGSGATNGGDATNSGGGGAKTSAGGKGAADHRFPSRAAVELRAVARGVVNAVAVWYDLDLGGGVTLTTAPQGIGHGGRVLPTTGATAAAASAAGGDGACCCGGPIPSDEPGTLGIRSGGQGQSLQYLSAWVSVAPGCTIELAAERRADGVTFTVGDVAAPPPAADAAQPQAAAGGCGGGSACAACARNAPWLRAAPGALVHAPRAAWLEEGAGIADPEVWAVKRCGALLAECLARAPAMRLPPLWRDLQLLQLHCGSLGLDAAALGAITQDLAMREEAAVAAAGAPGARGAGAMAVSAAACVEALGLGPPVFWH